jgi:hypothetical protein
MAKNVKLSPAQALQQLHDWAEDQTGGLVGVSASFEENGWDVFADIHFGLPSVEPVLLAGDAPTLDEAIAKVVEEIRDVIDEAAADAKKQFLGRNA